MKRDMVDYMNALTSCSLDAFEQIIAHQYRKFSRLYRLVKEYSEDISKIRYEFDSPSSLDVVLYFDTKKSMADIRKDLEKLMIEKGYDGTIKVSKKLMYISIILEEE